MFDNKVKKENQLLHEENETLRKRISLLESDAKDMNNQIAKAIKADLSKNSEDRNIHQLRVGDVFNWNAGKMKVFMTEWRAISIDSLKELYKNLKEGKKGYYKELFWDNKQDHLYIVSKHKLDFSKYFINYIDFDNNQISLYENSSNLEDIISIGSFISDFIIKDAREFVPAYERFATFDTDGEQIKFSSIKDFKENDPLHQFAKYNSEEGKDENS